MACSLFPGSRPRPPSPFGHFADPEAQELGCSTSDYSKHRSAEFHYAYDWSGAAVASRSVERMRHAPL
jgi:hypothetical protein